MDLAGATREQLLGTVADLDAALTQRAGQVAELRQLLAERDARLSEQHIRLVGLAEQVAELQARLGKDSSNSAKPPSSDPPHGKRKAKRGLRSSSGRKPGKQPGAPGVTLRQVDDPDEIVVCKLDNCPDCGACLADAPVESVTRRQVFDPLPPPPRPHVTEYQLVKRRCRCGRQVAGPAPTGVLAPVSYGPSAAALAVYAGAGQYLPVKRAAGVLATLGGMNVSTGWLAAQRSRAARLVEAQFLPHVRELLRGVGVLHVDETPGRVAGKLAYVHVACTEFLTAMHVGDRSAKTIDAGGVLPEFTGVLVRDGYAGYTHLVNAVHAWCGAHLVRDLHGVSDADPDRGLWAIAMAQTLLDANTIAHTTRTAGASAINPDQLATIVNHYRGAAGKGISDNQTRTGRLAHEALVLARRFRDNEAMILRFATDLTPFSNNEAEVRHEVARYEWTRRKEGRPMTSAA
ncbi:MAG: IS66 family transposase [Mycobacteriales bacterium]